MSASSIGREVSKLHDQYERLDQMKKDGLMTSTERDMVSQLLIIIHIYTVLCCQIFSLSPMVLYIVFTSNTMQKLFT